MKSSWIGMIVGGVICLAGCDKSDPAGASSGGTSAAVAKEGASVAPPIAMDPPANAQVAAIRVSLTEGPLLAQVNNQEMIHPAFSLAPPDVESPLLFAALQNEDKGTSVPLILKKIGAAWKVAEVSLALNQEWVYAAACPPRKEIFAVLDAVSDTDAAAVQVTMLVSRDAGKTWEALAAVKKPTSIARYAGFSMSAAGVGRLSMHVDDDSAAGITHGYYDYKTTDGGKTWTGPSYEADDVIEADSMKDADKLSDAIKSLEAPADPAK